MRNLYLDQKTWSLIEQRFPGVIPSLLGLESMAISIGGSYGAGVADARSDLDIFVFTTWNRVPQVLEKASQALADSAGAWLSDEAHYYPGFGHRVRFILPCGKMVEFFAVASEQLNITALSRNSRLLRCDDPSCLSYLSKCQSDNLVESDESLRTVAFEYLASSQKLFKCLSRKDIIGASEQLAKIRSCFYCSVSSARDGKYVHPFFAEREEVNRSNELIAIIAASTINVCSLAQIREVYFLMRAQIIAGIPPLMQSTMAAKYLKHELSASSEIAALNL